MKVAQKTLFAFQKRPDNSLLPPIVSLTSSSSAFHRPSSGRMAVMDSSKGKRTDQTSIKELYHSRGMILTVEQKKQNNVML